MFNSCAPHLYVRHPVSVGDVYFLSATYYSDDFQGKKTSSGEKFDKNSFTCAAKSFPAGTILEIKNISNDQKIAVRVNDTPGKNVVDLSEAAFKKISSKNEGRINVRIKVVGLFGDNDILAKNDTDGENLFYTIQLGAFKELDDAKVLRDKISKGAYIYVSQGETALYRVRVGKFDSKESAKEFSAKNLSGMESIVVAVKE